MRVVGLISAYAVAAALAAVSIGGSHRCGRTARVTRLRGGAATAANPGEEFDYIILGGGAAGCVLANRLSADPAVRVLVLEAGVDSSRDLRVRVPAALPKLFKSEVDWDYQTEPSSELPHEVYLCRGKTLGGSSCTNVMLYHRGSAADYHSWEAAGAKGWGPDAVLPFYRMHEEYELGESKYHGVDGPLSVQDVPYQNELAKTFLKAAGQLGYRANADFNDWGAPQEGFGRYKVMQRNGERCSATSFLELAKKRPNLSIRTSAHITRVVVDGSDSLRATGVEYEAAGGEKLTARLAENGEAVLCAGAVQTPQLLMLSGIGPKEHLQEKGIKVLKDAPGVGVGIQDHPAVLVAYKSTKKVCLTDKIRLWGTSMTNPWVTLQWLFAKSGPLTSVACDHGGFFRSSPDLNQPDLQVRFVPACANNPSGMSTLVKYSSGSKMQSGFTTQIIACRPKSSGRVLLRSSDPHAKPLLQDVYLSSSDDADLKTLREGIKLGRKLCNAAAFDYCRGDEVFPGTAVRGDAQIDAFVRESVHSANALTSSCRMGAAHDPMAVLDPELRVRGVRGLRVADSSAMPQIIGGQTAAPTLMLAERAATMLMKARTQPQQGFSAASEAGLAAATV